MVSKSFTVLAAQLKDTQTQLSSLRVAQSGTTLLISLLEAIFIFTVPKIRASFKYFRIIKVTIIVRNLKDKGKDIEGTKKRPKSYHLSVAFTAVLRSVLPASVGF